MGVNYLPNLAVGGTIAEALQASWHRPAGHLWPPALGLRASTPWIQGRIKRTSMGVAGGESDRRNGTVPCQQHHLRLRPLLPGQEHGEDAPELPGVPGPILRSDPEPRLWLQLLA